MVSEADIAAALQQERIRLHAALLPSALLASASMAVVLVVVLWPLAPRGLLLGWLACVVVALGLRLAVGLRQRRAAGAEAQAAHWLRRHRAAYALHGAVWAALPLLPLASTGPAPIGLELVVFALAAMIVGAFSTAAFDLRAGAVFAVLPLLSLLAAAALQRSPGALAVAAMALLLVGLAWAGAWRGQRSTREGARLRLTAALRTRESIAITERADEANRQLADQHGLMRKLLQTTRQGFWFIDTAGRTTDLNPAMAELLGGTRETLIGRMVGDFFTGEDLQTLQRQLALRATGESGQYEATLTRTDGSRAHCVCHGTPLHDSSGRCIGSVGLWTDLTARRQAEATLRGYELVVNSITDLVSVVDTQETYVLVNDAWCRASGVPRAQAVGRRSTDAAPGTVSPERRRALNDCVATGEVRSARGSAIGPGAAGRLLETTYFPHRGDDGRVQFVAMVTRDITEQERSRTALELREAEQRAFLDAFPGYLGRIDEHLVYTYASRPFAALMGLTPETMVGRTAREVLGPEREAAVQAAVQRALAGERVVYEHHLQPADGSATLHMQITLARGRDPRTGTDAVYSFAIDVTPLKRAEQALISARDEAERANRAKSEFLSHMSHELRTPLNAILGFGQLLESDPSQALAPHQQAWVREMLRGAEHLLGLINEVLDLGRIEAGELQLDPEPVALRDLAEDCMNLVRTLADSRQVRLHPPPRALRHVQALADRRRLKQVLLNLLGNAIKYNRPGGDVRIVFRPEGDTLWLAVRDTGPGLGADEIARLFQPFERLGAAQSGVEGTGIGLALSRRLVEAMGGRIGVDSQPGEGSTFWVRVPRARTLAPAGGEQETSGPVPLAPAASTVLYIEDNPVNLVLMEAMLARLPGLRLLTAAMPGDGLRLAQDAQPGLVLLDIQLPEMDGFEVLRRLHADPRTAGIPVVAVSANALQHDIDAALAAGFAGYLTKPLRLDLLLETVQRLLQPPPA